MRFNMFIYLTTLCSNMKQSNCFRLFHIKGKPFIFPSGAKFKKFRRQAGATQLHFQPSETFSAQLIIALHFTEAQSPEQEKDDCSEAAGGG